MMRGFPAWHITAFCVAFLLGCTSTPVDEDNQLPNAESDAIPNQTSTQRDPSINQTPSPVAPRAQSESDLSVESSKVTDDTYYSNDQVNAPPRALTSIQPRFPEKADKEKLSGEVTLQLLIDETGKVRDLAVLTAKPEGYFEQSALDAFRNSRWTPAQKDGHAVKSRVLIRVSFSLHKHKNVP